VEKWPGNTGAACLLVELGLKTLSMSPLRAARVRRLLRRHAYRELQQRARDALSRTRSDEVRRIVQSFSTGGRAIEA